VIGVGAMRGDNGKDLLRLRILMEIGDMITRQTRRKRERANANECKSFET
jgi:hypothetical protein